VSDAKVRFDTLDEVDMAAPPLHLFCEAAASTYVAGAVPFFSNGLVQVYLSELEGKPCFSNEGTHDTVGWMVDFLAAPIKLHAHPIFGPVHAGFFSDAMAASIAITAYLSSQNWPDYYLSGHSKAASEVIAEHAIMKDAGHPPLATRAFEPARAGGPQLEAFLKGEDIVWTRTINSRGVDLVTDVAWGTILTIPLNPSVCWSHIGDPVMLVVPDSYDIPQKHEIPAVLAAVAALA
jgi:hypothetical protein